MIEIRWALLLPPEKGRAIMQLCHPHPFLAVINWPYLLINEPICELTPHQSTPRQQGSSYLGIEPALNYRRQTTGEQWNSTDNLAPKVLLC